MSKIDRMAIPVTKIGPDFHVDNTRGEVFDCRLETCHGQCDCEKIEQCKYSPEYYLRKTDVRAR